jgi:23S rRNA (cytidine1920-2'-O)/16S rRNA (cytidine1409-2'-O)-methyltransferase
VMERTNARYLEALPEPVDLVAIDVSFISLRLILPQTNRWLRTGGDIVALIKPQFEAGRRQVGKGGVVRDPAVHHAVLAGLTGWAEAEGLGTQDLIPSPIKGPAGNVEFLVWLRPGRSARPPTELVDNALQAAAQEAAAADVGFRPPTTGQ